MAIDTKDIATNRNEYVANLEGTGMVGTDY